MLPEAGATSTPLNEGRAVASSAAREHTATAREVRHVPGALYRRLVLATLVTTFALIVLGGVVRVTGSGLGCPDWPLCHGRLVPPLEASALIEYSHRLLASVVSVLVIGSAGLATAFYRRTRSIWLLSLSAVGFLVIQVILGGITVLTELHPDLVTAHLATAEALLAVLVVQYVALRRLASSTHEEVSPTHSSLLAWALIATFAIYTTLLSGAFVRASGATLGCTDWPLCQGRVLPQGTLSLVHATHRYVVAGASVMALVFLALAWRQAATVPLVRSLVLANGLLWVLQVLLGAFTVWTLAQPVVRVAHLAAGTALWGGTVALATALWSGPAAQRAISTTRDYAVLTKPGIIVLLLITTVGAMFLAAQGVPALPTLLATVIGGALAAGGASAINHYVDRDIDRLMPRTRRRPLPSGRIRAHHALFFGLALNLLAFLVLLVFVNALSAFLAILGSLFYIFVYTFWLKRSTPQNIVIGGAAGAIPPLVGWAAITGSLDIAAFLLFAIVFFWTPPHFWALALYIRDEYATAGVPMLPVVQGEHATARAIFAYTLIVVPLTLLVPFTAKLGLIYWAAAATAGAIFTASAFDLLRRPERLRARRLFLQSLAYLAIIFIAIMVDRAFM